ncbi:MAG: hypothetical protein ABH823_00985 [bacterium]
MSNLIDSINKVNSLTEQIEGLKALNNDDLPDAQTFQYTIAQSFNDMLDTLLQTSNDDDDDKKKNDPFSFLINSNQEYASYLLDQNASLTNLNLAGVPNVETKLSENL